MEPFQKPVISIALCTYNGEKFVEEQIDSLLKQDYRPIEIIAVDDCSSDNTFQILQEYASENPCVKVYRNEKNIGFLKNFERSLSICKGDYIAFCDQDDIWLSNKLSLQIENIGTAGLIYHDSELIDDSGNSLSMNISDLINMYQGDSCLPFLLRNCVSGHSILIDRKMLSYITPFQIPYHDWWSAYVIANITGIKYLNSCLVKYRQHQTSATKIMTQSQENPYLPPIPYLSSFDNFPFNKNPKLVTRLKRFWEKYVDYSFTLSELLSLIWNLRLFLFISKIEKSKKIKFVFRTIKNRIRQTRYRL